MKIDNKQDPKVKENTTQDQYEGHYTLASLSNGGPAADAATASPGSLSGPTVGGGRL